MTDFLSSSNVTIFNSEYIRFDFSALGIAWIVALTGRRWQRNLTGQPGENGLLRVQPVLGLGENRVGMCLECFFVDLLASIGRQAVHHQRILLSAVWQEGLNQRYLKKFAVIDFLRLFAKTRAASSRIGDDTHTCRRRNARRRSQAPFAT